MSSSSSMEEMNITRLSSPLSPPSSSSSSPSAASGSSGIIVNRIPVTTKTTTTTSRPRRRSSKSPPRRPKSPLRAYQYFFNDEVRKASSSSCGVVGGVGACPAAKRRRSNTSIMANIVSDDEGDGYDSTATDASPPPTDAAAADEEDVGKLIGERWRSMPQAERIEYENMAVADSERYEHEIERYYKKRAEWDLKRWNSEADSSSYRSGGLPALVGSDSEGAGERRRSSTGSSAACSPTGNVRPLLCGGVVSRSSHRRSSDTHALLLSRRGSGCGSDNGIVVDPSSKNSKSVSLRSLLTDRRTELLSDASNLHGIAAAREIRGAEGGSLISATTATRKTAGFMQQRLCSSGVSGFGLAGRLNNSGTGGGTSSALSSSSNKNKSTTATTTLGLKPAPPTSKTTAKGLSSFSFASN